MKVCQRTSTLEYLRALHPGQGHSVFATSPTLTTSPGCLEGRWPLSSSMVVLFTITWKGGDELLLCSQTPSSGDSQLCSLHPVTTARTEVNVFVRKNSFQEISYKYITQILIEGRSEDFDHNHPCASFLLTIIAEVF